MTEQTPGIHRAHNFSAGPGALPLEVLQEVQAELLDYNGTGVSVLEMSHRSKAFETIIAEAEADLRTLMQISDDYGVLFLQGGASLQFSMLAMSFLNKGVAQYVVTGAWGQKAIEAARIEAHRAGGTVDETWTGKATNFNSVPDLNTLALNELSSYVHITSNETIHGVRFHKDPSEQCDVFCDMSSDILSREVDVDKYALIYAGAQKNMGPAGATVVIIRKSLLEKAAADLPPMLDYKVALENKSLYNTPSAFSIYVCGKVYKHLLQHGGVKESNRRAIHKSSLLYNAIDNSGGFYKGHAEKSARSLMNVVFTLPSEDLTKSFVTEAKSHGMIELNGHRSIGGCRASIYNSIPESSVQALAAFMRSFAERNG